MNVLVINCGSSSLKFQLINSDTEAVLAKGLCERIGIDGRLTYQPEGGAKEVSELAMPTHTEAIQFVIDALTNEATGVVKSLDEINAVGHRVVHGGEKFTSSVVVTEEVKAEKNSTMEYHIGTMIEIPRAALTADKIAEEAEFFSFGTNDLTQMTFGFSRDDAGKFLNSYYETKIYEQDPFAKLDQTGVGQLVRMAAEKGKATRPNIKLGICGEHGRDPASVEFCHKAGLTYVSCSPFRVPIARLAAAQAAIKANQK